MPKAAPSSVRKLLRFPRSCRLVSKQDFQSVFAHPKKTARRYLLALFQPSQQPHARLGIIIAKRRVKQAVDRNRLRRVIRESFRHHKETLKGLDIIVLLRSECTTLGDRKTLRHDIDNLWLSVSSSKPV